MSILGPGLRLLIASCILIYLGSRGVYIASD